LLAQFQDYLSDIENPRLFNCASCQGRYRKCLFFHNEIEIEQPDFNGRGRKKWKIKSIEDAEGYLNSAMADAPDLMEIDHLLLLSGTNLCPIPLITPLSRELYKMHSLCGNGLFPYPGGYLDQLAIFIDANSIISAEEAALFRRRTKK